MRRPSCRGFSGAEALVRQGTRFYGCPFTNAAAEHNKLALLIDDAIVAAMVSRNPAVADTAGSPRDRRLGRRR